VWLPARLLRAPASPEEHALAEAVGAMAAFVQRYTSSPSYREEGAEILRSLPADPRNRLLIVLLPLLRRLDYQSALHALLSDLVGGRAVRIDVHTGVLPKDRELTTVRGLVINRKRGASTKEHARFFDRLGELIVEYVRTGDANFHLFGPVPLDRDEYRRKLAI